MGNQCIQQKSIPSPKSKQEIKDDSATKANSGKYQSINFNANRLNNKFKTQRDQNYNFKNHSQQGSPAHKMQKIDSFEQEKRNQSDQQKDEDLEEVPQSMGKRMNRNSKSSQIINLNRCSLCFQGIQLKNIGVLDCGHLFHIKCISKYLQTLIGTKHSSLNCPKSSCSKIIQSYDVREYTDPSYYENYEQLTFKKYILENSHQTACCPNPNCKAVFIFEQNSISKYQCQSCKKAYCLNCNCFYHSRMSCEEYQQKRKVYYDNEDRKKQIDGQVIRKINNQEMAYPRYWKIIQKEKLQLFDVQYNSQEYKFIQKYFTMKDAFLAKRIQNSNLYERYCHQKATLEKQYGQSLKEELLFHGTRANDPKQIYSDKYTSFNINFANQGSRGKGIYFAKSSLYSNGYAYTNIQLQGTKKMMFLSIVLVGHSQNVNYSNNSMMITDLRDKKNNFRYDSVFSNYDGSDIYVVFHNNRAYPLYLISY